MVLTNKLWILPVEHEVNLYLEWDRYAGKVYFWTCGLWLGQTLYDSGDRQNEMGDVREWLDGMVLNRIPGMKSFGLSGWDQQTRINFL